VPQPVLSTVLCDRDEEFLEAQNQVEEATQSVHIPQSVIRYSISYVPRYAPVIANLLNSPILLQIRYSTSWASRVEISSELSSNFNIFRLSSFKVFVQYSQAFYAYV
jgi:hypothetical protein